MPTKSAQLINGTKISKELLAELKTKVEKLDRRPGLAAILIGNDPASKRYIEKKKAACQKVGIDFNGYFCGGDFYPEVTESEILDMIDWLNKDKAIDAIIIQLPIPAEFDTAKIVAKLDPKKDVDGFHPKNQKQAAANSPLIKAVDLALRETGENLPGKTAVIVSKNPIFAEPLATNLKKLGLKVEVTKPTEKLAAKTKAADVLLSVVGQPGLIKKNMVKPKAIVVDIGTTLVGPNTWKGDVDPAVSEVAAWLTPVPGGIGPLTVAMLLENTYQLSQKYAWC